jgi:hypothetical protein
MTNAGEDVEEGTLTHWWWEYKLVHLLWKSVWKFIKKLKIELLYDAVIPLLDIYLNESKSRFNNHKRRRYIKPQEKNR